MSSPDAVQKPSPPPRAHQIFTKAVRSLHSRRDAPPPIPIRVNPSRVSFCVTPATPTPPPQHWVTIELSNYPPQLTHEDVRALFHSFTIAPDFALPNTRNLAYPLRTFISVAGEGQAERAVRELCGEVVGGRRIYVAMVNKTGYEEKEVAVRELADEMKLGIVNTARVYYPRLASKILEVRECVQGTVSFAFLQARELVTIPSALEVHRQLLQNKAQWEFVAAGRWEGWSWTTMDGSSRLAALKDLQETVQKQGVILGMWSEWESRWSLEI
ncbi:hypothetical protein BDW02DRAFT_547901 [Decorospora gaudefroyi]|uniref:RRM domain-containing protein n=1 Tax=Decorospora gaudefroyi TaxID=184978 RepID=A0A6A5KIY5_9PLEO|nr:hypothetical protein BDW02DRAFT_547901 [Decorospora gaudefroyi]